MTKRTFGWIGLVAGIAAAWACGSWEPDEGLLAGDTALSRPFETSFLADLATYHGPSYRPRGWDELSRAALLRRIAVGEGILAELRQATGAWTPELRQRHLRPIALHLASRIMQEGGVYQSEPDGPWKIVLADREVVFPPRVSQTVRYSDKDAEARERAYAAALKQLPAEFRLYLRSLDYGLGDGLLLCDELLSLPPLERAHLTALAHYRRAHLRMDLLDRSGKDDAELRRSLGAIRSDLDAVGVHVRAGSPNLGDIALAAQGWLAHLRCKVLPLPRLRALGEADLGQAARIYLEQRRRGVPTADDSIFNLLRAAAEVGDYAECAQDPLLRRLMTAFLSGGGRIDGSGATYPVEPVPISARAWLATLRGAKVDFSEDAARLAALEYRVGEWEACARTLREAPVDDTLAVLLRARLDLRAGRSSEAIATLGASLRPHARRFSLGAYFYGFDGESPGADPVKLSAYRFDGAEPGAGQLAKVRSELATLLLAQGRYAESLDHFYRTGQRRDYAYVAECVLSVDELKAYVDRAWPEDPPVSKPAAKRGKSRVDDEPGECTPLPPAQAIRHLLAQRLFRAGRVAEALPYYPAEVRPAIAQYLEFMAKAVDKLLPERARADAYWRAALVLRELGEETQFCAFGQSWTNGYDYSDESEDRGPLHWHDAGGLPRVRIQPIGPEADSLLAPPGADEQARVNAWIAANLARPDRAHRSARYAVARHALKAAELLPEDDQAGAQILQFAGNLLKYMEPAAAQPYYRLLATRFKGTPLGAHARAKHWFSPLACEPDPDWISKGR
jgi:hypothetical protein